MSAPRRAQASRQLGVAFSGLTGHGKTRLDGLAPFAVTRTPLHGFFLSSLQRGIELARRHRAVLDRLIRVAGIASTLVVVLVALLLRRGNWSEQRFLLVYFAPLLLYGAAWARDRLARLDRASTATTAVDTIAFAAGALRSAGGWGMLPYSGHMLFLTYAVATPGPWILRLIAYGLIAMTTTFKLVMWHDATSWGLGIAAGLALAGLRAILARRAGAATAARVDPGV